MVLRLLALIVIVLARSAWCAPAAATQPLPSARVWVDRAAAEVAKIDDPFRRADALTALADLQARVGDDARFAQSVAAFRAYADAQRAEQPARIAFGQTVLARAFARRGDIAGVRAAIAAAEQADPKHLDSTRFSLVSNLSKVGAYDIALEVAQHAEEPSDRAFRLEKIAESQAAAGKRDAAKQTFALAERDARKALELKKEDKPYDTLCFHAGSLIEAGELESAEKLIAELPAERRVDLQVALAAKYLDQKDRAGYERNARSAYQRLQVTPKDSTDMIFAVPGLAALQLKAGDAAAAAKTRALVDDAAAGPGQTLRVEIFYQRALDAAVAGDVSAAKTNLKAAREAETKEKDGGWGMMGDLRTMFRAWLPRIAQAHIDAGHPAEAVRMLESLGDNDAGAAGIRVVLINAHAAAGDTAAAKKELAKVEEGLARELAESVAIKTLAQSAALPERWTRLQEWIATLPTPLQRANGYCVVADVLSSAEKK
jgi:hypothetical protein